MGAVFGIVFLITMSAIGGCVALGGLVCAIVFAVRKKTARQLRKRMIAISVIVTVIGLAVIALPAAFFGFILSANMSPPDDFVDTGVYIEEGEYQNSAFTADGVRYVSLPSLEANFYYCYDICEPVFCYRGEGIFGASESGNYYRIPNELGFDIVIDGYSQVFCREDQVSAVNAHYASDPSVWYAEYEDGSAKQLSAETAQAFEELFAVGLYTTESVTFDGSAKVESVIICSYSSDLLFQREYGGFAAVEGELYAVEIWQYGTEYVLCPLPEEYRDLISSEVLAEN